MADWAICGREWWKQCTVEGKWNLGKTRLQGGKRDKWAHINFFHPKIFIILRLNRQHFVSIFLIKFLGDFSQWACELGYGSPWTRLFFFKFWTSPEFRRS